MIQTKLLKDFKVMQSKEQKYYVFNSDCRYELLTSEILAEQNVGVPAKNVEGLDSALNDKADKSLESKVQMLESIIKQLTANNEINNDSMSVSPNLNVSESSSTTKTISANQVVVLGGKIESITETSPAVLTVNASSASVSNLEVTNARIVMESK